VKPVLQLSWQPTGSLPNMQTSSISPFSAYRPGDFGFNELLHRLILFRLRPKSQISTVSGGIRESSYLFQRIAITIQRFNSVLFGDSFLPGDDFDF